MSKNPLSLKILISSLEELHEFVMKIFPPFCVPGQVIALYGDLGAGKTTFVKCIAPLFSLDPSQITSPTFGYQHLYGTAPELCHFDLYRITSLEDFIAMGFKEFLEKPYVTFIEWPEVIETLLPSDTLRIYFTIHDETTRKIVVEKA